MISIRGIHVYSADLDEAEVPKKSVPFGELDTSDPRRLGKVLIELFEEFDGDLDVMVEVRKE